MGIPREPKPVKLFAALLSSAEELLPSAVGELEALFGSIDSTSRSLPWSVTGYYEREMGSGLLRQFVSFGPLIPPDRLADIKLRTQGLEEHYQRVEGGRKGRRVNVDPGYLDLGKVVLASTKSASHRIYLHSGIYGQVTLLFSNGVFHPFAYTYPDYLWPETLEFFLSLRSSYLTQLKQLA
jgi:hypothetical protein